MKGKIKPFQDTQILRQFIAVRSILQVILKEVLQG